MRVVFFFIPQAQVKMKVPVPFLTDVIKQEIKADYDVSFIVWLMRKVTVLVRPALWLLTLPMLLDIATNITSAVWNVRSVTNSEVKWRLPTWKKQLFKIYILWQDNLTWILYISLLCLYFLIVWVYKIVLPFFFFLHCKIGRNYSHW